MCIRDSIRAKSWKLKYPSIKITNSIWKVERPLSVKDLLWEGWWLQIKDLFLGGKANLNFYSKDVLHAEVNNFSVTARCMTIRDSMVYMIFYVNVRYIAFKAFVVENGYTRKFLFQQ